MAVDVGDVYRLQFELRDTDGELADADAVTLTITLPDNTQTVVSPDSSTSVGEYQHDYLTVQPGRHVAHWVATGSNPGADVGVFDVITTDPPYLISIADAKKQLNIEGSSFDDELRVFVGSATATVERIRGEVVVRRSVTEVLTPIRGQVTVSHLPVISVDAVASSDGTITWNTDDLDVDAAGIITSRTTPFSGPVTVTVTAGRSVIPDNYLLAGRIIVEHLWQTKRGSSGPVRPGGMDVMPVAGIGYAVPNRAVELLGAGLPGIA